MSTWYHYDKDGNNTGSTSSEPPQSGGCLRLIAGFALLYILYKCISCGHS